MIFGHLAAGQDIQRHVGGISAQLAIVDAAGGKGARRHKGVGAGVVGNACPGEDLGHGASGAHYYVVRGGKDGVHPAYHGVGGGQDLIGVVSGLFQIGDAFAIQIGLGLGDGGLGVGLGVGIQQAHGLDAGVDGQHHVQDKGSVQRVRGTGDVGDAGEARGDGVGDGGIDHRDAGAVGGGSHALCGQGSDGDDGVKAGADDLGADLVQHRGVILAVEDLAGHLQILLFRPGGELGLDSFTDLVQRSVVHLLNDGDFQGVFAAGGAAAGAQGQQHHQGQDQGSELTQIHLFHNDSPFQWMVLCGRLDGVASAAPSSAGKIHTHASFSRHKKCPYSPVWGARTGKTNILRYHLACRFRGHLCRCKHTAGPVTLAMRQKILGKKPFPLPSAVHLPRRSSPHFQQQGLSVDALTTLSPLQRFTMVSCCPY